MKFPDVLIPPPLKKPQKPGTNGGNGANGYIKYTPQL